MRHRTTVDHDTSAEGTTVHHRDVAAFLRLLIAATFVVALVLVGFDNRDDVRIGYVFGQAQAPIWLVVAGSAIAGMVIAWLVKHRRRHEH
jgi:uncharacterized integral membrane protein